MNCCGPSRRQALLWAGLAATAGALATGGTAETEAAGAATTAGLATAAGGELLVRDLEVVTVTDTSVVITWFTGSPPAQDAFGFPEPVAADTELQFGTVDPTTLTVVPGSLKTVFHDAAATATTTPRSPGWSRAGCTATWPCPTDSRPSRRRCSSRWAPPAQLAPAGPLSGPCRQACAPAPVIR
jgi:hypothetical protein